MLFLFAFTLFVSAALLFLVQPMIGKMILPRLGGTPGVWNTCMVFFQGVLLVGYAYTHAVSNWGRRSQLLIQGAILALPFVVLPFSLGGWQPPADHNPVASLLWLLLGLVGLPFFVVATSAPLLQKWFSGTSHPAARDPYFLYGASNLGSMLALLAYPILVEPLFPLEEQAWIWTAAYGVLVILIIGCGLVVWNAAGAATARAPAPSSSSAITPARRLRWIGLAAAPSSLMLGVTTYLTTDIAAVPFFWVVPLALYLLTFILVFARWPVVWTGLPHTIILYVQPCCLMFLVLAMVGQLAIPTWLLFALHVASFFATALVCHGELARDRPAARYLTEFYLWMSVGGVLGGMFNALVAPLVFTTGVIEYPIAMALACVLRPSLVGKKPLVRGDSDDTHTTPLGVVLTIVLPPVLGFLAYLGASFSEDRYLKDVLPFIRTNYFLRPFLLALPIVAVLGLASRPLRFGLGLACVFLGVGLFDRRGEDRVYESRGFYGFVKVRRGEAVYDEGRTRYTYNVLIHGGIDHGRQNLHFPRRPISYFHPTGGIGQLFTKFSWPDQRLPASLVGLGNVPYGLLTGVNSEPPYAVVGLGTGTLAAFARPYQHVVFYEIDPQIKALSLPEDGRKPIFSFLQDAKDREANLNVVLGDGRLSLKSAPEKYYHILALDAFSSDAIPVHLLTQEALDLYLSKVADGGAIVFNTTNRYVDIGPVLADLAQSRGLEWAEYGDYSTDEDGNLVPEKFASDWLIMRRPGPTGNGGPPLAERLGPLWKQEAPPGRRPWSDDYSNLLSALRWR